MTSVFADTYYFIALISPRDKGHRKAIDFSTTNRLAIVTTQWVMTELADGLSDTPNRHLARHILHDIEDSKRSRLIPANDEWFHKGFSLYDTRSDKHWSLTDCISFAIMQEQGIREALTADQHFEQAGFVALLR